MKTRIRRRKHRPWWRRRRTRRIAVFVALAVLGLLAIDSAWALWTINGQLTAARRDLTAAATSLEAGRTEEAASRFELARAAAARAGSATRHPPMLLAGILPFVGDDVDAVRTLARSGELAAESGVFLTRAARSLGVEDGTLGDLRDGRRIHLDRIEEAVPNLTAAAERVEEAAALVRPLDPDSLIGPLAGAAAEAKDLVAGRARVVTAATEIARFLPGFLGAEEPRRYLLTLENLSAPRGPGGFLGLYGILSAEDGVVLLEEFDHAGDLPRVQADLPPDVADRYAPFGADNVLFAANYSPDFPTSARTALAVAQEATGETFHGVIAADPLFMADVLAATGPIDVPAWPEPLTADTLSQVVHHDSFLLESAASDRAQEGIGVALWNAVLEQQIPLRGLGAALADGATEGHFDVYSTDPEEQARIEELGAAGTYEPGPNALAVVWQDAVSSRTGYFAHKEIRHAVTLDAEGAATVETEARLRNEAPDGPPSILLGHPGTGDPPGHFAAFVNVYLPENAEEIGAEAPENRVLGLVEEEFGRPVAFELVSVPAGEESWTRISHRAPGAAIQHGEEMEYRFEILPQPALRPDRIVATVTVPDGAEITAVSPGLEVDGTTVRYEGEPVEKQTLWVRYG